MPTTAELTFFPVDIELPAHMNTHRGHHDDVTLRQEQRGKLIPQLIHPAGNAPPLAQLTQRTEAQSALRGRKLRHDA